MLPLIGLIPLLPLLGFLVCGIFGRRLPKGAVAAVACISVLLAFLVSLGAVLQLRSMGKEWKAGGQDGPAGHEASSGDHPRIDLAIPSYEIDYWTWLPTVSLQEGPDDRISYTRPGDAGEGGGVESAPGARTTPTPNSESA